MEYRDYHREYKTKKTNNKFNKMIVLYASVAVICILVMLILGAFGKKDEGIVSSVVASFEDSSISATTSTQTSTSSFTETSSEKQTTSTAVNTSSNSSTETHSKTSSKITSSGETASAYLPNGDWRLIIANKQHSLPKSYKIDVSYVVGNYRLDSRIVNAYKEMISAAKNDGISLVLISGFRTYEGQEKLFNNKVNYYLNQGYNREKAKELAAQYVAPPGTSEHLTGLAVDLISPDWYSYNSDLNSNFEKTKQFKWLYENCADYGFVLRYPKDKVSITGYSYEPWHYRYVGKKAAKEIMSKKICLEEYVS